MGGSRKWKKAQYRKSKGSQQQPIRRSIKRYFNNQFRQVQTKEASQVTKRKKLYAKQRSIRQQAQKNKQILLTIKTFKQLYNECQQYKNYGSLIQDFLQSRINYYNGNEITFDCFLRQVSKMPIRKVLYLKQNLRKEIKSFIGLKKIEAMICDMDEDAKQRLPLLLYTHNYISQVVPLDLFIVHLSTFFLKVPTVPMADFIVKFIKGYKENKQKHKQLHKQDCLNNTQVTTLITSLINSLNNNASMYLTRLIEKRIHVKEGQFKTLAEAKYGMIKDGWNVQEILQYLQDNLQDFNVNKQVILMDKYSTMIVVHGDTDVSIVDKPLVFINSATRTTQTPQTAAALYIHHIYHTQPGLAHYVVGDVIGKLLEMRFNSPRELHDALMDNVQNDHFNFVVILKNIYDRIKKEEAEFKVDIDDNTLNVIKKRQEELNTQLASFKTSITDNESMYLTSLIAQKLGYQENYFSTLTEAINGLKKQHWDMTQILQYLRENLMHYQMKDNFETLITVGDDTDVSGVEKSIPDKSPQKAEAEHEDDTFNVTNQTQEELNTQMASFTSSITSIESIYLTSLISKKMGYKQELFATLSDAINGLQRQQWTVTQILQYLRDNLSDFQKNQQVVIKDTLATLITVCGDTDVSGVEKPMVFQSKPMIKAKSPQKQAADQIYHIYHTQPGIPHRVIDTIMSKHFKMSFSSPIQLRDQISHHLKNGDFDFVTILNQINQEIEAELQHEADTEV